LGFFFFLFQKEKKLFFSGKKKKKKRPNRNGQVPSGASLSDGNNDNDYNHH